MMKRILLSMGTMLAMNSFAIAGGDIVLTPVVQENDDAGWYGGLGLAYDRVYSIDKSWFDNSVPTQDEVGKIVGIVGYNFNEYIGIEGRISQSIYEEDYADLFTYGIFVKPQYRFRDRDDLENDDGYFTVYGLLGFGGVKVDGTDGGSPAHPDMIGQEILSDTSFQWGFGISYTFVEQPDDERYALKDTWSVFIDYTSLIKDADIHSTLYGYDPKIYDKLSVDGITAGLLYKF